MSLRSQLGPFSKHIMSYKRIPLVLSGLLLCFLLISRNETATLFVAHDIETSPHILEAIARCADIARQAGPAPSFYSREVSDRFQEGTRPVLIQNAKIWTGSKNGTEVIRADILMDKGLIKSIGRLRVEAQNYGKALEIVDAEGAWVTPGIVDVHSHLGGGSSPALEGAVDDNSIKGTAQPWLRMLDGLNTHDNSYLTSIGGGVTTSLVLPGSANAIGGQAYVIKLRETAEKSPSSMLLEPPYHINDSFPNPNLPPRWRHMKHACGENPSNTYGDTRMDTGWGFRQAYNTARQIKGRQDEYCSRVASRDWKNLEEFPQDLQWEALVDVLRGRVKVNVHCYEAVDLDALVRLSNEFKFPIAAVHHASDAYLVPDLLKRAYGKPPSVALFATMARYKREAYRASEFAPRILAENGLTVLMKSDHPEQNSRYLLYEAQQAYFYGLPDNLAIASVTSNPAETMGMGHRIGYVKTGYDADLVVWDSHPLALGATPSQVFIDGIPQLESPYVVQKPSTYQRTPRVPNFDEEAKQAVVHEGLQPLTPKVSSDSAVVFLNVQSLHLVEEESIVEALNGEGNGLGVIVTHGGSIVCYGTAARCMHPDVLQGTDSVTFIDLEGGSISPGLASYGSPLGLENINQEPSTNDGNPFDPLLQNVPGVLGGGSSIIRATDGLMFGTRDALLAYRSGVTIGVTAPSHGRFFGGLGTAFSLGAIQKLDDGATIQEITAVHVTVRHFSKPSISTQIATLRHLLLGKSNGESGEWFKKIRNGQIPLVVEAHSADVIATLVILKKEIEAQSGHPMQLTITGATEAHILARELGEAQVGVILSPSRSFPSVWEERRILPGPPFTKNSSVTELISNGVVVGIGCEAIWSARNLPFDVAWTAIESGGRFSREQAMALGSTNLLKLLGVKIGASEMDLVATKGGPLLSMQSKVVGIISPRENKVDLFDN